MQMDGHEKRRHPRVKIPFMMKWRTPNSKKWDAVRPINMSESGIFFLTTEKFSVGAEIDFFISNPSTGEQMECVCKVLRAKESPRGVFYETVVVVSHMSEEAKQIYNKIIQAFGEDAS